MCATALSSALGARMYLVPESQAVRSSVLCLHIGGSPDRAILPALRISVVLAGRGGPLMSPSPHEVSANAADVPP
jgi:hypothetical protein